MTVRELIEELQAFHPDAEMRVALDERSQTRLTLPLAHFVNPKTRKPIVFIRVALPLSQEEPEEDESPF